MNTKPQEECISCKHELCPTCFFCHNMDCASFVRPMKKCFDKLLPIKPQEERWIVDYQMRFLGALNYKQEKELFQFINTHFIHRENLNSWLEEQKKEELPIGLGHTLYGHNQAIQSVIEYIEL